MIGFWVHYYFTLTLILFSYIPAQQGKEFILDCVCVRVCVFRSSQIVYQGTYLVAAVGGCRSVRIDGWVSTLLYLLPL